MPAWLALENGRLFRGELFGAPVAAGGEAVFHTGMTGYQEILTDPSYAGQIVVFTAAHIGNYGIHGADHESPRLHPSAVIVRDFCRRNFHRRSEYSLDQVLRQAGVPALAGVDTRALTTVLREAGACRAWVGSGDPAALLDRARRLPPIGATDWVARVSTSHPYTREAAPEAGDPCEVAVLDCGVKKSLLDSLTRVGCRLRVFPHDTPAARLLAGPTEGVFLSNGPGDPAGQPALVDTARALLASGRPVFGVCLGHQILARALGATTVKLPFGHHGANHPVLDLATGRVEITSQNHNYAVPAASLDPAVAEVTHRSLNDDSVEGLAATAHCAYSVQYHPEAAPGPSDSRHLFDRFVGEMRRRRAGKRKLKQHAAAR